VADFDQTMALAQIGDPAHETIDEQTVGGRHAGGGHAAGEPVDRSAPVRRVPWYR